MAESNIYDIYIKWLAMPQASRTPRTVEEFAAAAELSPDDISEFQSRDSFYDDLYKAAKNWGKAKVPEMLHMLYEEYKVKKNPTHLRMFKELLEIDKEQKNVNNIIVLSPTDASYRQIVAREAKLLEDSSAQSPADIRSNS